MADIPDQLTLKANRDREGRRDHVVRRALTALIGVFILLGALNAFGQRPQTTSTARPAAQLSVYAPMRVRGGLYYQARFHIRANRDLKNATLVLDSGWVEGITINTVEPSPVGEGSENGKLVFELGHVPANHSHLFYLQMQVNPTNVGRRDQNVELRDGDEHIATVARTITVFP
ncbi:MAG TPA: hypothetical protein VGQ84_10670 [Gaiellaceae bacterium]|nr:hypothetical protein [Gaiellaceae bacterium]